MPIKWENAYNEKVFFIFRLWEADYDFSGIIFCTRYNETAYLYLFFVPGIICVLNYVKGDNDMKTAIIYYSRHHENTKKLIDKIAKTREITLIDASNTQNFDLTDYDLIGFASGIYYSKFHKSVLEFAKNQLPMDKQVFFLYTYGAEKDTYTKSIEAVTSQKHAKVMGSFGCLGLDTFGPFKLVGGIAKGHPNQEDLNQANQFFEDMVKKIEK